MHGVRHNHRSGVAVRGALIASLLAVSVWSLSSQTQDSVSASVVRHERGQLVAPVYEGWFRDAKGDLNLSFGYLNLNFAEELDVPIGPDNKIEPGPADQGQPTHFIPRRQWGAFSVIVPRDLERQLLAEKRQVTWTLRANGQTASVPANMGPAYSIDALKEPTVGNEPPELQFATGGRPGMGPFGARTMIQATAGVPVTIDLSVHDDKRALPQKRNAGVKLLWTRYRGAGTVQFSDATTKSVVGDGTASVTVTFNDPGEYALRVEAIDSEIHDFQCCWSNGFIYAEVRAVSR
jgi:hypothetical protein